MTSTSPRPPAQPRPPAVRSRALRWSLAVLLVLGGTLAATAGWLRVCEPGAACRPPHPGDVVVLGWLALVALLLAPDLSEASVAGLLTLKSQVAAQEDTISALSARLSAVQTQMSVSTSSAVGGGAVVTVVSGTATGAWARGGEAGLPTDVVAASRYLAGELLIAHLGDLGSGLLETANLRLYLPGEDGSLLPVLDPPVARYEEDVWRPGEGAVGRAWVAGALVAATGPQVQTDVAALPEHRRARYAALRQVVAVPVPARDGTPVGVLSASSRTAEPDLLATETCEELVAAAEVAARVLVDLLGWAGDTAPPPVPAASVAPSARAATGTFPTVRTTGTVPRRTP